jgi:hypothetical protein
MITGAYVLDYPGLGLYGELYDQDYNQVMLTSREEVVVIDDEVAVTIPEGFFTTNEEAQEVARFPLLGEYLFDDRSQMNAWLAARRSGQVVDHLERKKILS